jgi:hypothetical protein
MLFRAGAGSRDEALPGEGLKTASIEGGRLGEPAVHRTVIGPVRGSGPRKPV